MKTLSYGRGWHIGGGDGSTYSAGAGRGWETPRGNGQGFGYSWGTPLGYGKGFGYSWGTPLGYGYGNGMWPEVTTTWRAGLGTPCADVMISDPNLL